MRIAALVVYPVKSCRGVPLQAATLGARGLEHDRELMLVTPDGRFVTQREHPRLALVTPRLGDGAWTLEAPGRAPLAITPTDDGPRLAATVWRDTVPAVDQGDAAAAWFGAWLGFPVRLVRMASGHVRACNPAWAGPGAETGFADAYPALLCSTSSLADVSARVGRDVPMERFRPNVVVDGAPAWAEDGWTRLRLGPVEAAVVKPCERCGVPSTDQATGERTTEPGATLATFRVHDGSRWPALRGKLLFGQNLVHRGPGTLRVGDEVRVLAD